MLISKLKKEITDELTTMESNLGDMDIKELTIVDRPDRVVVNYKTANPMGQRKADLSSIKNKIRDEVRYFNEDFEPLTDAEKASIKSLECLMIGGDSNYNQDKMNNQNKMIWHPYKDCGDAPKVAEYQNDVFLCKVQMFWSENDEPVGTPVYKVLLCDDNGIFHGYPPIEGGCYNKVIAWTEIIG